MSPFIMNQLFDPQTFNAQQAAGLVNIPGQSLAETNSLQAVQAAQMLNPSPNIPVAQITPQTPFKVPPTPQDTANYNAMLAGTQVSLPEPVDPEQAKVDATQQAILDRTAELSGQEAFSQQKETEFGLPAEKKALNDLQAQLKALNAEAMAEQVKLENQPGVTTSIAVGQQAQAEKMRAIKALAISGQIQAVQGNIALAQDQVERSVRLKYEPLKQQLELLNRQLDFNYKSLDRSERKKADALKLVNDEKLRQLDIQEANEKDKNANLLDWMSKYRDAGITLADSLETAQAKVLTKSLTYQNELAEESLRLQNTQSTIDNRQSTIEKRDSGLSPTSKSSSGSRSTSSSNSSSVSSQTQAVIDNPSLFDDLTPTVKGRIISELQANGYDTSNIGVKGLSDTAIKEVSQTQKALDDLASLKSILAGNEKYIGPIKGIQRFNPFSKARQVQADVDRVRQTVGKALEGGVLRKEDEEKYKKILATLADTPETATYKIEALIGSIQRDIETYKSLQKSGGRSLDVGKSLEKKTTQKGATFDSTTAQKKFNY